MSQHKLATTSFALAILAILLSLSISLARSLGEYWKYLWDLRETILVIGTMIALAAILVGLKAKKKARQTKGRGLAPATTGVILGLVALPSLLISIGFQERYEVYDHPTAVASLRTLASALQDYADAHPQRGFPATMEDLPADTIPSDLARGVRTGYRFTYSPRSTQQDGRYDKYSVVAIPIRMSRFARLYFFMDQTGQIHFSEHGPADASSSLL